MYLKELNGWLAFVLGTVESRKEDYIDIFGRKTKVDNSEVESDAIKAFERGHTKLF